MLPFLTSHISPLASLPRPESPGVWDRGKGADRNVSAPQNRQQKVVIFPLHLQIVVYIKKFIFNHHPVYIHVYSDGQFCGSLGLGYSPQ